MTTYRSLNHTKWHCQYHVVFIPKYRRKAMYGGLRKELGEENPWTIQQISELAFICLQQGKWAEAERLAREAAVLARKYLEPTDNKTATAILRHSWALE